MKKEKGGSLVLLISALVLIFAGSALGHQLTTPKGQF